MEGWKWGTKEERYQRNQYSFSSALLDAIYRSTDDDDVSDDEAFFLYRNKITTGTAIKGKLSYQDHKPTNHAAHADKRTTSIEKKLIDENFVLRPKASELTNTRLPNKVHNKPATIGAVSHYARLKMPSCLDTKYADAIVEEKKYCHPPPVVIPPKKHHAAGFFPAGKEDDQIPKSRGAQHLKLYKDFRKAKQPNSPGSRIASFLGSLFPTTNKSKLSSSHQPTSTVFCREPFSPSKATTPSSRSCLNKTPATRGDGATRSVRFHLPGEEPKVVSTPAISGMITVKDLMDDYRRRKTTTDAASDVVDLLPDNSDVCNEEADDDGATNCSSSDLFELDHLSVGPEELPVYETTCFATNHPNAKRTLL